MESIATAAIVVLGGCSTAPPIAARVDPGTLTAHVEAALATEPRIAGAAKVSVDAARARVTLSGVVATKEDRETAGRLACSVKGVTVVYNLLDLERRPRAAVLETAPASIAAASR